MKTKVNPENCTLKIVFRNLELHYFGGLFQRNYFPGPRNAISVPMIEDQQAALLAEVYRRAEMALAANRNKSDYSVTLQFYEAVAVYFLMYNRLFDNEDPPRGLELVLCSTLFDELYRFTSSWPQFGRNNLLAGGPANLIEG